MRRRTIAKDGLAPDCPHPAGRPSRLEVLAWHGPAVGECDTFSAREKRRPRVVWTDIPHLGAANGPARDRGRLGGLTMRSDQTGESKKRTWTATGARWLLGGGPLVLALCLASSASAIGVERYASPTGTGAVCTQVAPCTITVAINNASNGDDVIVEPGSYGSVSTPLNTSLEPPAQNIEVGGVAGQARPVIYTSASNGLALGYSGNTVSYLDIEDSAPGGYALSGVAGTYDQMIVRETGSNAWACGSFGTGGSFDDSVCDGAGTGDTGMNDSATSCSDENASQSFANDDFYGSGSGDGLDVDAMGSGCGLTVSVTNTIMRGGANGQDITAPDDIGGSNATITAAHSDYVRDFSAISNTVTPAGTATNITSDPALANPAGEQFQETAGSPTIDAGLTSATNGSDDIDGAPRTAGGLTDIGAYEYTAGATASAGSSSAITATGATLSGTVNSGNEATTYRFNYGTTPALGTSTTPQTIQPGAGAIPVSAGLSGLQAGTTYYWDISASNASGPSTSAVGMLTTVAAPALSLLKLSLTSFHAAGSGASIAKKKTRTPGTVISYIDSEAATTTFVIEAERAGVESDKRCIAPKPHSKRKPGRPCIRLVALGSFKHADSAGANSFRFSGRLGGHALTHGHYTLTATPENSFQTTGAPLSARFAVKR
jgi:hypothetical protein